jgi:hypothetical protein
MLMPNARQGGGTPDGAIDYGVHFIDGQPLDGLRVRVVLEWFALVQAEARRL